MNIYQQTNNNNLMNYNKGQFITLHFSLAEWL